MVMSGLTVAAAAMQILNNALGAIKAAKERSKGSKDSDLKEQISTLYDSLLNLKEAMLRLTDENSELRIAIERLHNAQKENPELRQVGAVSYYYLGDKGPFCQTCYVSMGKLVALPSPQEWSGGLRRTCSLCSRSFWERPMPPDDGPAFAIMSR
jgi:hypothetical protein